MSARAGAPLNRAHHRFQDSAIVSRVLLPGRAQDSNAMLGCVVDRVNNVKGVATHGVISAKAA
jgi:hypothetical protein